MHILRLKSLKLTFYHSTDFMLTSKISLIIRYVTIPVDQKFTCNMLTVPLNSLERAQKWFHDFRSFWLAHWPHLIILRWIHRCILMLHSCAPRMMWPHHPQCDRPQCVHVRHASDHQPTVYFHPPCFNFMWHQVGNMLQSCCCSCFSNIRGHLREISIIKNMFFW